MVIGTYSYFRYENGPTLTFASMAAIAGLTVGLTQIHLSSKPGGCQ